MRNIAEIIKDEKNGKELSQTERQISVAYIQGKYDAIRELKLDNNSKINKVNPDQGTCGNANTIDYRRAFKIACELLNGATLYGVGTDTIFQIMMNKDGIVTNDSYEEYILTHMQELDQGQYASSSEKSNKSEIPTDWKVRDKE